MLQNAYEQNALLIDQMKKIKEPDHEPISVGL